MTSFPAPGLEDDVDCDAGAVLLVEVLTEVLAATLSAFPPEFPESLGPSALDVGGVAGT